MILIAFGANLPDVGGSSPLHTCQRALASVRALEGLDFTGVSDWYRTSPAPPDPSQPDYCNGIARFSGAPDPAALLDALHRIEATFGRVRSTANAARTLDLDLIEFNGLIRHGPPPVLPHPRAHLRDFVLRPLVEVAPDWVHPVLRQPASALLAALPDTAGDAMTRW